MIKNKIILLLILVFILFSLNFIARADGSTFDLTYESYTYDFWENPVPAPQAYEPQRLISGEDLGTGEFNDPRDIVVGPQNNLYIVDTGNNRILIVDENYDLIKEITEFENQGKTDTFDNPRGIDISEKGELYIADRDNERIVILNEQWDLKRIIGYPESDMIGEDFRYRPAKVGVSPDGRVFVVSDDVYEGVMNFDSEGDFRGFFGAPTVSPDFWEYIWRVMPNFMTTSERREQMSLLLPTEFTNLAVDERGFVYTTGPTAGEEIKLLSSSGSDVLKRNGFSSPSGDYGSSLLDESGEYEHSSSRFVDIIARENGIYSALDAERGRIFTYDNNGNLLYIFGGETHQLGTFNSVKALAELEDKMLVLDSRDNRITVFTPTKYRNLIHGAIDAYNNGNYELAEENWKQVLNKNANFDRAYTGMGRAYLRSDEFYEAMQNFRLGQNREDYSRAFIHYRRKVLVDNFNIVVYILLAIIILVILLIKFKIHRYMGSILKSVENKFTTHKVSVRTITDISISKNADKDSFLVSMYYQLKNLISNIFYSLYVIVHPVGGFWNLKNEDQGSVSAATIILFFVSLTYVFMRQYTGFIFNPRDLEQLNLLVEFASILIPFFSWCGVNWSLTTLMEGKGTFVDVYMMSCYALTPIILVNVPLTIISNFLTAEESAFYFFLLMLSICWGALLIFMGTIVVHEYDVGISVLVIISILLGIILSLFLGLLFFNVIEQFFSFLIEIYYELSFRI